MTEKERRQFARLRAALGRARKVIKGYREDILESHCLHDRRTLRLRPETLDRSARPFVDRLERLLRSIDAALGA
jgi:hypothetical protein